MQNGINLWRDVLNPMVDFRRDFDRLFDDWSTTNRSLQNESRFVPACDVEEQKENYLLTMDVAGVNKDDIKMEVMDNQLVISGERKNETERKEEGRLYSERRFGKFQRTFSIPAGVNVDRVQADYRDGILRVLIPKAEVIKPRQIKITDSTESGKITRAAS